MKKKIKMVSGVLLFLTIMTLAFLYISQLDIDVLNPKGLIAIKEKKLFIIASLLMLIVVVPVLILTVFFAWKYRASNKKATYTPDWEHSHLLECLWWGVPFFIIIILAIMTWKSSHDLDPYKPLESDKKPIVIQVVALDWKWLFIYPEQGIATVNYIRFPDNTPINFQITADAPMNSFWIPSLAGQIYAMPGMMTQLHLIANETGTFKGASANLSGEGFAGMNFIAEATSVDDFNAWVDSVRSSDERLNSKTYQSLAEPSSYNKRAYYKLAEKDLFNQIMMKFNMAM